MTLIPPWVPESVALRKTFTKGNSMRKRTLGNGVIVAGSLLTAIGLTVAVASAATSQPSATPSASVSAGAPSTGSGGASGGPTASASATATASPSSSSSSDGSECADVYLVTSPAKDTVGKLCTAVTNSSTTVSGVTVTFTPSSTCSGSVMLRVSGIDSDGAEFGAVKSVTCGSGAVSASFTPVTAVTANTNICGVLLADKYTAAEACVSIS